MVVFGECGFIRAKWLYSGNSGCIRAKVVAFGQIGGIRQKWFYCGNSCFIRAKLLYSGKGVVFQQK